MQQASASGNLAELRRFLYAISHLSNGALAQMLLDTTRSDLRDVIHRELSARKNGGRK